MQFNYQSIVTYFKNLKTDINNNPLKYIFIIPVTLFFTLFLVIPSIVVIMAAFQDEDGSFTLKFFEKVLTDNYFVRDFGVLITIYITKPKIGLNDWYRKRYIRNLDETWYIFDGVDHGVILNSIIIGIATTIIALIVGISLAMFMAKRDFPGKRIVSVLLLIPLIIPPFVGGMGFWKMVGQSGLLNDEVLVPLFGVRIIIKGLAAIIFVEAFHYYTLVYLNVYSSLSNIDPSLEEQAKNMGAKGFTLMRTVTLPLAMPGIAAGGILTFILAVEDLGTPLVFASRGDAKAKETMTYYIYANINPISGEFDAISGVIATILLLIAILGFLFIRKFVAMRSYSMLGKGRAGTIDRPKASPIELILFYLIYTVIFILSIISHVGVLYLAFNKTTVFPPEWSMEHFKYIFSTTHDVRPFIINTIQYSLISLVIVLIFGTMAAYAIARIKFKGKTAFDTLITVPIAIPGVVIGLGYLAMFSGSFSYDIIRWLKDQIVLFNVLIFVTIISYLTYRIRFKEKIEFDQIFAIRIGILVVIIILWNWWISTTKTYFKFTLDPFVYPVILLIFGFAVRKFPFAVRSIYAGLQQTSESLEEAAHNLGASRSKSFRSITIPLISLNIVAGGLITLVYTISEVSTTLVLIFLAKYGTITWTMGKQQTSRLGVFAALGFLLMVIQVVSLIISNVLLRNRTEAMTGI